jgi:hypothetical protein
MSEGWGQMPVPDKDENAYPNTYRQIWPTGEVTAPGAPAQADEPVTEAPAQPAEE